MRRGTLYWIKQHVVITRQTTLVMEEEMIVLSSDDDADMLHICSDGSSDEEAAIVLSSSDESSSDVKIKLDEQSGSEDDTSCKPKKMRRAAEPWLVKYIKVSCLSC